MSKLPRALALVLPTVFSFCACSGGSSGSADLAVLRDRDGDGLPDALERQLGSDARNPDQPYLEGADDDDTPDGPGVDAIPDGLERYLRALGASAPITAQSDTDGDGVPDALEVRSGLDPRDANDPVLNGSADRDNDGGPAFDGVSDALESVLLRRGALPPLTLASDSDADGIGDVAEVRAGSEPFDALDPAYGRAFDLDHDQVPDWLELRDGFNPLSADFPVFDGADDDEGGALGPDGDGVSDGLEGYLVRRGARAPLSTASDSDGDGAGDVAEVRAGFEPFDAASPVATGFGDADADGIADALEALLLEKGAHSATRATDSDRDRIPDFAEAQSGSDPFDATAPTLFAHFDLDHDGLEDFLEYELGADPLDPDSPLSGGALDLDDASGPPRDPLSDALEALLMARGSSAPVTTYSDADGDGLPDFVELRLVSDPLDPDSPVRGGAGDQDDEGGPAGDGISDAAEAVLIALGASGPLSREQNSDGDVIPDAIELVTGTNWLDRASPRPNTSADIDGDGAVDYLELVLGFDPRSADDPLPAGGLDGDGDGLSDALEELLRLTSTPLPISPVSDSDADGLYDYLEIALASERHDPDSPIAQGALDVDEHSGPSGDGLTDALEHYLLQSGAARPVSTRSDTDGDLVPDYLELRLALDAFDARSPLANGHDDDDHDGVSNALEFVLERLGAPAPVDGRTDSDLDGAPDHLEIFAGAEAFDADSPVPNGAADADGDGLSDALEHVLVALGATAPVSPQNDTDADGIPDAYEVRAGTHPLRGDHPLANGGLDTLDASGPRDTLSDALEALLIAQGAAAPVSRANDSDADGAPDHLEVFAGSLPFDAASPLATGALDADGDRLSDALESVLVLLGAAAPVDARSDTDGDGAPDAFEVFTLAHPLDADVPLPGGGGGFDGQDTTGPPADRVSDALELLLIQLGCTGPIATASDFDLDGLPDAFEARSATNPLDGDSPLANGGLDSDDATGPAGDGISDALEAFLLANGASGPVTLTTDTDGDGVPDFYEVFKGSDPFDPLDEIAPGTRPLAAGLSIAGIDFEGRTLTGSYRYVDAELDPEGLTTFRWLRDGVALPGEVGREHVVAAADLGTTLSFEVTPVARFAFPPETALGLPQRLAHAVPVPAFPRGAGGPGGVGVAEGLGDVRVWLRADERVETLGNEVTAWRDLTGHRSDARAIEPTRRPDLVPGAGLLGGPAVRFDGATHLTLPRPVEDNFTLVVAFATTSTVSNGAWYLSPAILGGETPAPCGADYHLGINGGKPLFVVQDFTTSTGSTFANGLPHTIVASRVFSSGRLRLFVDGAQRSTVVAGTASLICPTNLYVGSSTGVDGYWTGDLFEVAAFDHVLNTLERTLIEEYLAARHGSDPNTELYAFRASHGGDVAGIGLDADGNRLDAAEGAGILRISQPSALSAGDFLLWGTDAPRDFALIEDVPPPFPRRLERTWAYSITDGGALDGVGTVDLRFRVGGLFLSEQAADFALLFDDDGAFFDARVLGGGVYDPDLDTIEFRGVPLGPERFFTLAVKPL